MQTKAQRKLTGGERKIAVASPGETSYPREVIRLHERQNVQTSCVGVLYFLGCAVSRGRN